VEHVAQYYLDFSQCTREEEEEEEEEGTKNNPNMPSRSVGPPARVMRVFMRGHLQDPESPVGFVKASRLGGGGTQRAGAEVLAPEGLNYHSSPRGCLWPC